MIFKRQEFERESSSWARSSAAFSFEVFALLFGWAKPKPLLHYLCHLSKNLFNEANYLIRQTYFSTGAWIKTAALQSELQDSNNFQRLPRPTALKTLTLIGQALKSLFITSNDWQSNPEKHFQQPRPPRYKRKDGEFLLWFTTAQLEWDSLPQHISLYEPFPL